MQGRGQGCVPIIIITLKHSHTFIHSKTHRTDSYKQLSLSQEIELSQHMRVDIVITYRQIVGGIIHFPHTLECNLHTTHARARGTHCVQNTYVRRSHCAQKCVDIYTNKHAHTVSLSESHIVIMRTMTCASERIGGCSSRQLAREDSKLTMVNGHALAMA